MRLGLVVCAFAIAFAVIPAANGDCPTHFQHGQAPRVVHAVYAARTHGLCFEAYAALESGATRTPLWSAEHLTASSVSAAHALPRRDHFHAETALPVADRAELTDYVHSGFDRGHLAPSGDMPTPDAQAQSFSLANIVPQNAALNRGIWEEIEADTRALALRDGDLYIVTGPIFATTPEALNQRVLVPQALFKAIFDVRRNLAVAYIAVNNQPIQIEAVSIARLRQLTGIDVFPALPETVKQNGADILAPTPGEYQVVADAAPAPRPAPRATPIVSEIADRGPRFPTVN